jgi:hypothetical protein
METESCDIYAFEGIESAVMFQCTGSNIIAVVIKGKQISILSEIDMRGRSERLMHSFTSIIMAVFK